MKEHKEFRFPLYYINNYSEEEVERAFTPDEKALYHAQYEYLHGNYKTAAVFLISLKETVKDPVVKIGCLYSLILVQINLKHYAEIKSEFDEMISLIDSEQEFQPDLQLLINDLNSYFINSKNKEYKLDYHHHYHETTRNYIVLCSLYSIVLRCMSKGEEFDCSSFLVTAQIAEDQGNAYISLLVNAYVASLLYLKNELEDAACMLRKALHIAIDHRMLRELSFFYHYAPYLFNYSPILNEFDEIQELHDISDSVYSGFQGFINYLGTDSILNTLSAKDYIYVKLASDGMTNKEVADYLHLSISTVSKKYSEIYQNTFTSNKKELTKLFQSTISNLSI